jgi:hypothetical protein
LCSALVLGIAQVQLAGPLASAGVDYQHLHRRQVCRSDQQHVGAMGRQRATCHRSGDDPREVEHANTA